MTMHQACSAAFGAAALAAARASSWKLTTATAAAPTPVAPTPRAASLETRPRRVSPAGSGAGPAGSGRSSDDGTAGHGSSWVVSLGIAYSSWPFRGTFFGSFQPSRLRRTSRRVEGPPRHRHTSRSPMEEGPRRAGSRACSAVPPPPTEGRGDAEMQESPDGVRAFAIWCAFGVMDTHVLFDPLT